MVVSSPVSAIAWTTNSLALSSFTGSTHKLDFPCLSCLMSAFKISPRHQAEGAMDAANLLKPMLARGELRTIGATTLAEYRQHIEKDAAFERRFQQVRKATHASSCTTALLCSR